MTRATIDLVNALTDPFAEPPPRTRRQPPWLGGLIVVLALLNVLGYVVVTWAATEEHKSSFGCEEAHLVGMGLGNVTVYGCNRVANYGFAWTADAAVP